MSVLGVFYENPAPMMSDNVIVTFLRAVQGKLRYFKTHKVCDFSFMLLIPSPCPVFRVFEHSVRIFVGVTIHGNIKDVQNIQR